MLCSNLLKQNVLLACGIKGGIQTHAHTQMCANTGNACRHTRAHTNARNAHRCTQTQEMHADIRMHTGSQKCRKCTDIHMHAHRLTMQKVHAHTHTHTCMQTHMLVQT